MESASKIAWPYIKALRLCGYSLLTPGFALVEAMMTQASTT